MSANDILPAGHLREMDPYKLGRGHGGAGRAWYAKGHGEGGPASPRVVVGYGFWIFLLSDFILFAAFFAAYAVLSAQTAGGPSGRDLFEFQNTQLQTAFLLASSFAC